MVGARLCDSAAENVCRANAGHESPRPNVVERVRDRGGDQDRGFEDGHDPELRGQRPPFRLIVRGDRSATSSMRSAISTPPSFFVVDSLFATVSRVYLGVKPRGFLGTVDARGSR